MKDRLSDLTLMLLVCLAPWAYGSVEAWAELGLYGGIAVLTILRFGTRPYSGSSRPGARLPGLALGGLVVLALVQATPLYFGALGWIAPASAVRRAGLLPAGPEHLADFAGAAIAFPTATLSIDPDASIQTAARLAAAWLLFQCVLSMRGNPGRLAKVVVFNSAFLALFAIVQGLTWNGRIYWIRPAEVSSAWSAGGPFVSHNHLAAYLNMGLGLGVGLLLFENWRGILRRDSSKLWTAYAAVLIAVGVITSHSRSGFLGLLAASVFLASCLRSRMLKMGVGLAIVLLMIGFFLVLLRDSSSYGARLATILDLGDEGYQARIEVWRGAIRAWWTHPVWGAGLGAFPTAVIPFLTRNRTVFFARAENEYVDMLVEGGAVGFLLTLLFIVGVAGLARRAFVGARSDRERGLILGVGFGLVALLVQSFADFGPHVPAVGVTAIVLCGTLARMGQTARTKESRAQIDWSCALPPDQTNLHRRRKVRGARSPQALGHSITVAAVKSAKARTGRNRWTAVELAWLGSVVLAAILVAHGVRDAKIESKLTAVGLPLPGTHMATVGTIETVNWGLEDWRDALEEAVRRRPNWSEGHVRLGLVHLGLYRQHAKEWLEDALVDPGDLNGKAEPLWLRGAIHERQARPAGGPDQADILNLEPIRAHLLPAARSFLEARRCCLFLALPHAELAALDYLMVNGEPASAYATRALGLAGNDWQVLAFLAELTAQTGDRRLAATCWRSALASSPSSWSLIADSAALVLAPDEILNDVVTDARSAILFADRLYSSDDYRQVHDNFYRAGLQRQASDQCIAGAEGLYLEARALAALDQPDQARERMDAALALEPNQPVWREEYINWLLRWNRPGDARAQALCARYYSPDSATIRAVLDRTAEALARAGREP